MDDRDLKIERLTSLLIQERRESAKFAQAEKTIARLTQELGAFRNLQRVLKKVVA